VDLISGVPITSEAPSLAGTGRRTLKYGAPGAPAGSWISTAVSVPGGMRLLSRSDSQTAPALQRAEGLQHRLNMLQRWIAKDRRRFEGQVGSRMQDRNSRRRVGDHVLQGPAVDLDRTARLCLNDGGPGESACRRIIPQLQCTEFRKSVFCCE
jgi:hypothetical protein